MAQIQAVREMEAQAKADSIKRHKQIARAHPPCFESVQMNVNEYVSRLAYQMVCHDIPHGDHADWVVGWNQMQEPDVELLLQEVGRYSIGKHLMENIPEPHLYKQDYTWMFAQLNYSMCC